MTWRTSLLYLFVNHCVAGIFPAICLHLIITLVLNGVQLITTATHKDRERAYTSRHNLVFC